MFKRAFLFSCLICLLNFGLTGCTLIFQKGRRTDIEKITKLKSELSDLERAKAELEERLRREIGNEQASVSMEDKGLVITLLNEVLFDSGKAQLRDEALDILEKVSGVLNTTVSDLNIGIEGHTDNVPIKFSGWKSNWELSTARSISVLHYLIDNQDVAPERLSATGYGEYRPVASNDSKEGRQENRRVEIVILPKTTKAKADDSGDSVPPEEDDVPPENLK